MKTINFKKILFLPLFFLMLFSSCQNETTEITQPSNEETIAANSSLATLMRNTASNDGSQDNILDYANCLEVELPVTVIVDGVEIIIDSEDDFDLIEEIFDEFDNDEDSLEFIFPITIISSDYTTIVIENLEALEALAQECHDENEEDDDIECIDFQYPISISIYNTDFEIIDTITISDDEALYDFIENLEGGVLASLNFPVTMVLANGDTLVVENNTELEAAIIAAEDDCDEDDDYDWNDDDYDDIEDCEANTAELQGWLVECDMEAYTYDENGNIIDENYVVFNVDGTIVVNGTPAVTEVGTWEMDQLDNNSLTIDGLATFDLLNGVWVLLGCSEGEIIYEQETDNGTIMMVLEQDCYSNSECTADDVSMYLQECHWYASTNLFTTFVAEQYYFENNGTVQIVNAQTNTVTEEGTWSVSSTGQGASITLSFQNDPHNLLSLQWEVIECSEYSITLTNDRNDVVNFERECDTNNDPFECFESFNATLADCDDDSDGYLVFDLTIAYSNCNPVADMITYHETEADAVNNVNPIATPQAYTNTTNPQTIFVRVEIDGASEIFTIDLYVEDCGTGGNCSQQEVDAFLTECIWNVVNFNGSDDLIVYDFDFNSDNTVVIEGEGMAVTAIWVSSQTNEGVLIDFANVSLPNIQAISGAWLVVECDNDRIQFVNDNNETFIMEQDCR